MDLAGNVVRFRVSGEAPPEQVSAEPGEGGSLTTVPNPLHEQRWFVLGGLGLVLLAGFIYLYKKG
jgi:LPXTG-motif cell wall-anchored protein